MHIKLGLPDAPETVTATITQTLSPNLPLPQSSSSLSTISTSSSNTTVDNKPKTRPRSASQRDASYDPYVERKKAYVEKMKQREKMLYNDAVECPICFLVRFSFYMIYFLLINLFLYSIILQISIIPVAVISLFVQNVSFKFIVLLKHPQFLLHVHSVWKKIMVFYTNLLHGVRNFKHVLEVVHTAQ